MPETDLPEIQQQQLQTKAPFTVLAYSQDGKIKLADRVVLSVLHERRYPPGF